MQYQCSQYERAFVCHAQRRRAFEILVHRAPKVGKATRTIVGVFMGFTQVHEPNAIAICPVPEAIMVK
jgi:uncharacterized membrane protein